MPRSKKRNDKNTGEKQEKPRKFGGKKLFPPGVSGNPNGRPRGSKNFSTLYDEIVRDFAKLNNISVEEAELMLVKVGFNKAKAGNFRFWESIMNRTYGKPKESIDLELSGAVGLREIQKSTKKIAERIRKGR